MENETVLIIGGTSGFGLEVAKKVVENGNHVTIVGRHTTRVAAAVDTLGVTAQGEAFDAANGEALKAFIEGKHFTHVISMLGGPWVGAF